MAESVKDSDKLSSSDLGSSCCDNDVDISSDVKDKLESDDVVSVDGSASLTIDSLEEEDRKEEEQCVELPPTTIVQSEMLNVSDSKDSFYLHEQKGQSNIDNCKDKYQLSDLVVHSEHKTTTEKVSDSKPTTEKEPEAAGDCSSDIKRKITNGENKNSLEEKVSSSEVEHTTVKCEKTDTKSTPSKTHEDTRTTSTELAEEKEELAEEKEKRESKTNSTSEQISEEPHIISDGQAQKLVLRKSQSLTDESSTDRSPKPPRRSGIPRRKNSTQSMITTLSSGRSTPHNSPARVRRSLTINSADLAGVSAPNWVAGAASRTSPASFPASPVKVPNKLRRSASQSECSASSGPCCPVALSKNNLTSRLRFEKNHQDHGQLDEAGVYLTPSQRKDLTVKELRTQVKQLSKQLEEKEKEIEEARKLAEEEKVQVRKDLLAELEEARATAEAARKEVSSLQVSYTESVSTVATLQQQLEDVKKDMRNKLAESEEIFLEMYNKGRESAIFEHEEAVELQRKGGRTQEATEKELYNKLIRTQAELAKWQTIQRHESYHTMPVPGTEAETTLRFLKDSVFHFLTTDKKSSDEHLRAIVRILHFSEVQREKIAHAIILKRNKTGW